MAEGTTTTLQEALSETTDPIGNPEATGIVENVGVVLAPGKWSWDGSRWAMSFRDISDDSGEVFESDFSASGEATSGHGGTAGSDDGNYLFDAKT